MDHQEGNSNSDDDIFIQKDAKQEKPKKERKRKPREMSDETRERMAAILAKGRETRLKNSQLKREALEDDKQRIKETLKSKLKEVKKQLKEELVNESIVKKKVDKEKSPDIKVNRVATLARSPVIDMELEPVEKEENPPEKIKSTPVIDEHMKNGAPVAEQKFINPEPPKTQPKSPVPVSAPIPVPKPATVVAAPKPNLTAEYMRKLRAAYNF